MTMRPILLTAATAVLSVTLISTVADAGTVSITNNFAQDVRVGIHAGASESQVTVYARESRTYATFANKSIDKLTVLNLAGGATTQPYIYTVSNPASSTNYTVTVETGGDVKVTVSLIPTP